MARHPLPAPLSPDRRELAASYADRVLKLGRDAGRGHDDPDEVESEFGWVLTLAAARYRPGPLGFTLYLRRRLEGARADVARRYVARRRRAAELVGLAREHRREP